MDFKKIFILIVSYILLTSCKTQLYQPTENVGNIAVADLKKGRELYVNNCGSCHQIYLPKQFSKTDWAINLDNMQVRAKISDTEKRMIYDYLANQK